MAQQTEKKDPTAVIIITLLTLLTGLIVATMAIKGTV